MKKNEIIRCQNTSFSFVSFLANSIFNSPFQNGAPYNFSRYISFPDIRNLKIKFVYEIDLGLLNHLQIEAILDKNRFLTIRAIMAELY